MFLLLKIRPDFTVSFPGPHGEIFEFKKAVYQTVHSFSCLLIVVLIALYAWLGCPDIPETVFIIVRMEQMVMITIIKIGNGGSGWGTFVVTVLVIVRVGVDGDGDNDRDRK